MNRDKINKLPPFDQSQLEAIAKVLADTSSGLSGSEIAHLLTNRRIIVCNPTNTQWEKFYNAFTEFPNHHKTANNIIRFIHLTWYQHANQQLAVFSRFDNLRNPKLIYSLIF